MRIIRDDGPMGNIFTTALGIDWGVRRCNIRGCYEKTLGALISDPDNHVTYGLCEHHFVTIRDQTQHGPIHIDLDFTPIALARIVDWIEANDDAQYGHEWRMNEVQR